MMRILRLTQEPGNSAPSPSPIRPTADVASRRDVLVLDEERGNEDDEEENQHGLPVVEPQDENNNNDDDLNSDSTQPYDWPDDSQLPVVDALPTVIDLSY